MTLIEEAYAELEELPLEFKRKDIEKILFERTVRQLEEENQPRTQQNIHGRYYSLLSSMVMKLNNYKFLRGLHYNLDYDRDKANFIVRSRQTWVPDSFY